MRSGQYGSGREGAYSRQYGGGSSLGAVTSPTSRARPCRGAGAGPCGASSLPTPPPAPRCRRGRPDPPPAQPEAGTGRRVRCPSCTLGSGGGGGGGWSLGSLHIPLPSRSPLLSHLPSPTCSKGPMVALWWWELGTQFWWKGPLLAGGACRHRDHLLGLGLRLQAFGLGGCRELRNGTRWPRGWAGQALAGWAGLGQGLEECNLGLLNYLLAPPHCPLSSVEEGALTG